MSILTSIGNLILAHPVLWILGAFLVLGCLGLAYKQRQINVTDDPSEEREVNESTHSQRSTDSIWKQRLDHHERRQPANLFDDEDPESL